MDDGPAERLSRLESEVAALRRLAAFGRDLGIDLARGGDDAAEMLRRCVELTVVHLDAALARIWTVDATGIFLELRASAGLCTHTDGVHGRIPIGRSQIGRIAQDRRPLLSNAVMGDPSVPDQDWAVREGIASFAGFPLVVDNRLVGVWAMFARHPLAEATLSGMASVADQVALGIERKGVEERLSRERERLRVTLECVGDAVISTDGEGRITFLNPVARQLTGWTSEDAVGLPLDRVFRIVDEASREPVPNPALRALREGAIVGLANHTILIARDGTERAIDDSAAPIRDDGGNLVGAVLIFRDIDARRHAERELERSEARKAGILASALDAIISIDHEGRIVEWNPAAERIFGVGQSDVLGRSMAEIIIPPRMHEAHRRGLAHYLATGEGPILGRRFEITAIRPDGEEFPVEMAITPIAGSGPPVFTGHLRDITDRKQAEAEARRSQAQFRTLADSITQLAWMAEADGHLTWYNRRWHEYTGTTPEEMKGWGWQKVVDPAVLPSVLIRWRESIRTAEPFDMVFPIRRADGVFRPFLSRGVPLHDEKGRVVQWFGTNTDIADRIELEESLRAAKEEAEQANHAKTQFLAVLSHELRTPLNPILLAATSMIDGSALADDLRPTMEMIRHNVNLQARLIDDLLDVMRIVQGKMPLHWGVADCHEIIRHAVQVCQSEIRGGRVRLEVDLQAQFRHVNADSARLQQVFWNLIKNAVKFSPEGGLLTIRSRDAGDESERRLIVEVIDTGIGIDPQVLPMIFDPFQQGETSITRRFGGMGLGLAISRGVIDAHGGTIVAESAGPGFGTTFRVTLNALPGQPDVADGASPKPVERPASSLALPARLSILVVEDEDSTRRLMARLLRGHGHTITMAGTIEEAASEAERGRFDLIISDIGLPDGSGLELMRRIVAMKGAVPAIALTGYGMEEDIVRSREAGFTAHMTKPIDFTKLEAMIRQLVP
ncbi:PAS domain S-box protein [Tundrisphaera sp. TA3]|uniref:PAS domain S-box protein n=1 Tax=Tundrisphaera sp. TA3 TaxID=3435775 RepID=UPI003EC12AAB